VKRQKFQDRKLDDEDEGGDEKKYIRAEMLFKEMKLFEGNGNIFENIALLVKLNLISTLISQVS